MHLLTIVLPSALATANRITEPGSASDSAHSRHGARRSRASDERLEEPRPPARATMKIYFTHSGKQESREVTITDLDMGTFDYFCNPSIFGKNAGAGQCSKRLASAAGATPLSLGKMQGQGSAAKNWRALPLGGYPAIFGKNAGARQCSKKLASATAGGLPRYLWEKCRGKAVQQKLASATAGGLPSIFGKNAGAGQCSKKLERAFGKMQGQGSAVKNWRALLGGYPSILQEQGSAVKIWRAPPLGGDPCIFGKNMGALIPTKTP